MATRTTMVPVLAVIMLMSAAPVLAISNGAGDEGGPNFLMVDGAEVAVAMTMFYDSAHGFPGCRALSRAYRLDTDEARAFLGQFVELP